MAVLDRPAWNVAPADADAGEFARALGVHPLVGALLWRRGLRDATSARAFLAPSLDDLRDPSAVRGMTGAASLVADAVRAGRPIAVHGDYDVDGITATAILVRTLRVLGASPRWRLPHRIRDGYGLGAPAVEELAAAGARCLIAADCGITAVDTIARARALGLDVVVLDHHEAGDAWPDALVVAPAPDEDGAPCAAGLAFLFAWALRRALGCAPARPDELAALAALGTIADVVALTGDNRRLVAAGLHQLRADPPLGIRTLLEEAAIAGPVDTWHIGWQIAPRLNAPGRLGDPAPSLDLLLTDDPGRARVLARSLDALNRERQAVLEQVLTEATAQVEDAAGAAAVKPMGLVVAGEGWHPGVVGLVAGRLVEAYGRPAIAIAMAGGAGRGSARSVAGFNLVEALGDCAGHLRGFGGHAMAAGLSIDAAALPAFRECFAGRAAAALADRPPAPMHVDAEVTLPELTPALVGELGRLAPFGAGNPSPVLAVRDVRPVARRLVGDGTHLGMGVTDGAVFVDAIGFSMAAWSDILTLTGAAVDLAFTPELDPGAAGRDGRGGGRVRLRLRALDVPGVDINAVLRDTGAMIDRLFRRAGDFLGGSRYDGVDDGSAVHTKAVGVTFGGRQAVLATLAPGDRVRLRREPANPHDPHAVEVVTVDDRPVGYLNARLAGRLAPLMDAGVRYVATATGLTGGGEPGHALGVNLFIEREPDVADAPGALPGGPWRRWRAGGAREVLGRLPMSLNAGRSFRAGPAEALELVAAGRPVALIAPPGRGRAVVVAAAAALAAAGTRRTLVVVPSRSHAVHRAAQLAARLGPLRVTVDAAHGLATLQAQDLLEERLRRGGVDVLVATVEALREPGRFADFLPAAETVVADGLADSDWRAVPPEIAAQTVLAVGHGGHCRAAARARSGMAMVQDHAPRAPLTVADRRAALGPDGLWPVIEQALTAGGKMLAVVAPRDAAVTLAVRARERREGVAYLHGGLPARLREIVTQAFREGRLDALVTTVALDEEMLPPDVQQVVLGAAAPDLDWGLALCGAALGGHRPVTITLAAGADDCARYRRALEERAPGRETLAAVYRALRDWRGDAPFAWPDDTAWAHLAAAVPGVAREAIDAACDIFVEAGLASRETGTGGSQVQLNPAAGRRELAASFRYREGRRAREAFEAGAAWMTGAATQDVERAL
jgi:single-stranded-DNA-specific exonuclease